MLKGMIMLRVTDAGYTPADEESRKLHAKLKQGSVIAGKIWRSRSLPQFRLYWGLLEHVAKATEWETAEKLHQALKVRLGYFDPIKVPNGKVIVVPWSAAFDAMSQDEFQRYMDAAINTIFAEVIPGSPREGVLAEVEAMLG